MTFDEAKLLLTMHCCGGTDRNGQRRVLNDGFLLSLRPYRGQLIEKNFHQVMEALVAVGESLRTPQIDRELMSTLYALCFLGRHWALHPRGMLQRNNLIAPPEIARFELWVEVIESTIHALLSGIPLHHSRSAYTAYLIDVGCGDNVEFVIPLLARAVEDVQVAHLTARPVLALGRLAHGQVGPSGPLRRTESVDRSRTGSSRRGGVGRRNPQSHPPSHSANRDRNR